MKPVISPALDLIYNAQQDGYDWHSLGDDPAFWVRLDSSVGLAAGNYRLVLRIESDLPEGMAKLYFDRGEGLSERQVVYLPFKNNITASRIFAVPYPVKSIRFDPFECSAQFTVHQFEIEPLDATKVLEYFTDLTRRKLPRTSHTDVGCISAAPCTFCHAPPMHREPPMADDANAYPPYVKPLE